MSRRSPPGHAIILLCAWLGLLVGVIIVVSSTFSVFFGSIAAEFGHGRAAPALAYSLFSLSSTLAMPAVGRWVDRAGAGRVIIGCSLVFAAVTALLRFITCLWQLYALFLIAGIVSGGTSTLPYFKVLVRTFAHRRGLALGIANSGTAVGTFLFPLLAYRLNAVIGWRDAYFLLGAGVLIVTVPVALLGMSTSIPEAEGTAARVQSPAGDLTLAQASRTARFWIVGIAFFMATTALVGFLIHLVPLLRDRGLSAGAAAMGASAFGAAQLLGRVAAGSLLDRLPAGVVAAGLWLLAALSFSILWAGTAGAPLLLCTALVGLAFGGEGDVLAYFVGRLFGTGSFGRIYSVLLMIDLLGGVVGPYVFGRTFDLTGSYTVILAIMAVAMLAAVGLILCTRAARAAPCDRQAGACQRI